MHCRSDRIEPPGRIERIVAAARARADRAFCARTVARLGDVCARRLLELVAEGNEDGTALLASLKRDPGAVGLDSLLTEITKLTAVRQLGLKAKGTQPRTRRRGAPREDFVLEPVYWDAGTARLLPRLIKGRTRGPVFVTHRKPSPGKVVSPRDVCPDTGLVRLAVVRAGPRPARRPPRRRRGGRRAGWDPHEYRHSGLTHLSEQGASLPMLMAKSRHKKPENVR